MIIDIQHPSEAPSNFTANLQSGGSLDANTTYYFRISAKESANYLYSSYKRSKPSDIVSVTTDNSNKSVKLSWTDDSYDNLQVAMKKEDGDWKYLAESTRHYTIKSNVEQYDVDSESQIYHPTFLGAPFMLIGQNEGYDNMLVDWMTCGTGLINITLEDEYNITIGELFHNILLEDPSAKDYINFDSINFVFNYHLQFSGTGSITASAKSIIPLDCGFEFTESASLTGTDVRIYVNEYGWRYRASNTNLVDSMIYANAATGIRGDWEYNNYAYVIGGNQYIWYDDTTNITGSFYAVEVQVVQPATLENLEVIDEDLRINGMTINEGEKLVIKNVKADRDFLQYVYPENGMFDSNEQYEFTDITCRYLRGLAYYMYYDTTGKSLHVKIKNLYLSGDSHKISEPIADFNPGGTPPEDWKERVSYQIYWSVDYHFIDESGNDLEGVNVVYSSNGNELMNETSDTDGLVSSEFKIVTIKPNSTTSYDNIYEKNLPLNITIQKDGYQELNITLNKVEDKINELVVLKEEIPPIYIDRNIQGNISQPQLEGEIKAEELLYGTIEKEIELSGEIMELVEIEGNVETIELKGTIS